MYHIGGDGQPHVCHATKGNCPYRRDDQRNGGHYNTEAEARRVAESMAKSKAGASKALSKMDDRAEGMDKTRRGYKLSFINGPTTPERVSWVYDKYNTADMVKTLGPSVDRRDGTRLSIEARGRQVAFDIDLDSKLESLSTDPSVPTEWSSVSDHPLQATFDEYDARQLDGMLNQRKGIARRIADTLFRLPSNRPRRNLQMPDGVTVDATLAAWRGSDGVVRTRLMESGDLKIKAETDGSTVKWSDLPGHSKHIDPVAGFDAVTEDVPFTDVPADARWIHCKMQINDVSQEIISPDRGRSTRRSSRSLPGEDRPRLDGSL